MHLSESPGLAIPLGATHLQDGIWNFAVFSQHATAMDLCLFDPNDPAHETGRFPLEYHTGSVWHGVVEGLCPGTHYGFRVEGPWEPGSGQFFNPNKLLIDPYAYAISDRLKYHRHMTDSGARPSRRNNAAVVPKSILVDRGFDWEGVGKPRIPWSETIVYELHVAGFTKLFSDLPEEIRGTYSGLCHPKIINYLKELGVTAVQIMPVHHHIDDGLLLEKGLSNYWGYQTIGFFAPESRYASWRTANGDHVREFKNMVKTFHQAGLEVILDVVYNHTGEGSPDGPTVCFRGFDNFSYYRHESMDVSVYRDFTGCANTLDVRHPYVLKLISDSLRYWAEEMQVDGFRFDLAATLGRESDHFFRENGFLQVVHQDPIISNCKLIAEPWDLGPGGYQAGHFPELWAELNGKFRDATRRFWLGHHHLLSEIASRLTGSQDMFGWSRRAPGASVNFLTSHDGFALADLVAYNQKHNKANGENNRDGDSINHSINHGVEGETDDEAILDKRDRHRRNLVATLFLSLGTPFLLAGDERSRTQRGNNNAYCQDNAVSWLDWRPLDARQSDFWVFVQRLIAFRKQHEEWRRGTFFTGLTAKGSAVRDLVWYGLEGDELVREQWDRDAPGALQMLIEGRWLIVFNAADDSADVIFPSGTWHKVMDTTLPRGFLEQETLVEDGKSVIAPSSILLLHKV